MSLLRLNRLLTAERLQELYEIPQALWQKLRPYLPIKVIEGGVPYYLESDVDAFLAAWLRSHEEAQPRRTSPDQEWLSLQDAATVTGLATVTIRRAVTAGELKASNISSKRRPRYCINRADLLSWMEAKKDLGEPTVAPKSEVKGLIDRYFG